MALCSAIPAQVFSEHALEVDASTPKYNEVMLKNNLFFLLTFLYISPLFREHFRRHSFNGAVSCYRNFPPAVLNVPQRYFFL